MLRILTVKKCYVQEELKATKSKRQDTNEHVKFDMDYWKNKTNEDGSVDFALHTLT